MAASSSSSSSSAHHKTHHPLFFSHHGGATSAPPPTPLSQQPSNQNILTAEADADALSRLLQRQLVPSLSLSLSLPSRFRPSSPASDAAESAVDDVVSDPAPTPTLFTLSLSQSNMNSIDNDESDQLNLLAAAASEHGFFLLNEKENENHRVTSKLAESEAASLFSLPRNRKRELFPANWPVGFIEDDDEEEEEDGEDKIVRRNASSFCLDFDNMSSSTSVDLVLSSLGEMSRELEKVALKVFQMLSSAMGFQNPFGKEKGKSEWCSFMWLSEYKWSDTTTCAGKTGHVAYGYPYVVGLQYQVRTHNYYLQTDSGSVMVSPPVGSVLVTLGDIAQVWSNGKTKKVRGSRPLVTIPSSSSCMPLPIDEDAKNSSTNNMIISMTLLVTLPLESNVSPADLLPFPVPGRTNSQDTGGDESSSKDQEDDEHKISLMFNSFSFEEYAWRVYHERMFLKDPLDRYRIRL